MLIKANVYYSFMSSIHSEFDVYLKLIEMFDVSSQSKNAWAKIYQYIPHEHDVCVCVYVCVSIGIWPEERERESWLMATICNQ